IIDSIVLNSLLSFIMAIIIADADMDSNGKLLFIIIFGAGIVFFTYGHLRFHKSFLIDTLRNKQTKSASILVALFIFGFWAFILWSIFAIGRFDESSTHIARILILPFYFSIFTLRLYFKWGATRSYKKIIVITIDGSRYESMELLNLDDYIAIYGKETDKRIIIPSHQIKAIEYEYEKTTIADFIDKEH
ncbi:MAG: hypothetical protein WC977_12915, partial [Anaerovoracaceae bacterium]